MAPKTSVTFTERGDGLTPTETCAWLGLLAVHTSIVRQLDARLRASHQLSLTAYDVLLRLAQTPATRLRISELAAVAPLTISGISRMVDRLERAGLVRREASADDGRVACAALTDEGLTRLRAARLTYLDAVRRLFLDVFSEQELATLSACWRRLDACT